MSELTTILDTLRSRECQQIRFTLAGITITGGGYLRVARTLERGSIQLVRSLSLPAGKMAYNWRYNFIAVNRDPSENLIIHECTHARNDMAGRAIQVVDDEVTAYVAQLIYMKLKDPRLRSFAAVGAIARNTPLAVSQCVATGARQPCEMATAGMASMIAEEILSGRVPTDAMVDQLRTAIRNHPDYSGLLQQRRFRWHVGVGRRRMIPQSELDAIRGTVIHPPPVAPAGRRAEAGQGILPHTAAALRGPTDASDHFPPTRFGLIPHAEAVG